MGVPTSEVGYTSAMPSKEDHEVHKDMWGIGKKKFRHVRPHEKKSFPNGRIFIKFEIRFFFQKSSEKTQV